MVEDTLLVIPLGDGRLPLRVARCLGAIGARFVLFSRERLNVARASRHCARFVYSNPRSDDELLAQVLGLERRAAREIILPVTTEGCLFVARHLETLSTRFHLPPLSTLDSLTTASDKWELTRLAARHGIPILPSTLLADLPAPHASRALPVTFPALVKSRHKEGGHGAHRVDSATELDAVRRQLGTAAAKDYLVQPLVDGLDVSLSVFCEDGEIRSYTTWQAVFYGKVRGAVPLCVTFGEHPAALEAGRRLLRLLKWNGICDIDFFADRQSGEIFLLEVNARAWGNLVGCAVRGVNFLQLMCERSIEAGDDTWPTQTAGLYCYPKGLPRALGIPHVRSAILRHPIRTMGLGVVIRDPGPELFKVLAKGGYFWSTLREAGSRRAESA